MLNVHEMSVRDVANVTKKTEDTVRRWIRSGKLKARKPPFCRDYIIRSDDFNRFWYGNEKGDAANEQC